MDRASIRRRQQLFRKYMAKWKPDKANLSFICNDLSHLSEYAGQLDNQTFKLLKRTLPGPFTFILRASSVVPKLFKSNKKTVGIRVPKNNIAQTIVQELGRPILSTSLKANDDFIEYLTDPYDIHEQYKKLVDIVIDGGIGGVEPSTVVSIPRFFMPLLHYYKFTKLVHGNRKTGAKSRYIFI